MKTTLPVQKFKTAGTVTGQLEKWMKSVIISLNGGDYVNN